MRRGGTFSGYSSIGQAVACQSRKRDEPSAEWAGVPDYRATADRDELIRTEGNTLIRLFVHMGDGFPLDEPAFWW
jgi:hypothetical protein